MRLQRIKGVTQGTKWKYFPVIAEKTGKSNVSHQKIWKKKKKKLIKTILTANKIKLGVLEEKIRPYKV